jgi:hypothetical protein
VRTENWLRSESEREMLLSKLTTTKNIALPHSFSKWGVEDMLPSPTLTPLLIAAMIMI